MKAYLIREDAVLLCGAMDTFKMSAVCEVVAQEAWSGSLSRRAGMNQILEICLAVKSEELIGLLAFLRCQNISFTKV